MIIEGEWRETSLAFIDFIKINYNEDPYDYLKCMGYEIPYINNLKCGILYDYFKSYIELFRFLADIKSDINCLVFAPNINCIGVRGFLKLRRVSKNTVAFTIISPHPVAGTTRHDDELGTVSTSDGFRVQNRVFGLLHDIAHSLFPNLDRENQLSADITFFTGNIMKLWVEHLRNI